MVTIFLVRQSKNEKKNRYFLMVGPNGNTIVKHQTTKHYFGKNIQHTRTRANSMPKWDILLTRALVHFDKTYHLISFS